MAVTNAVSIRRAAAGIASAEAASGGGLQTVAVRYDTDTSTAQKGWYNPSTRVLSSDAWGLSLVPVGTGPGQAIAASIIPDNGGPGRIIGRDEFVVAYGQTALTSSPMQPPPGSTFSVQIQAVLNTSNHPDFYAGRIVHISAATLESYGSYLIETGIDSEEDPSTVTSLVLRRRNLSEIPMLRNTLSSIEAPTGETIPAGAIVTGRSQLPPAPTGATYAEIVFQADASIALDAIVLRDTNYLYWHSTRTLGMSIGPSNLLGRHFAENFVDSGGAKLSCVGGALSECALAEILSYTEADKAIMANVLWYDGYM